MVSINTNLSSLIVQNGLTNATNGMNKAVERLSTGYKINHAGDNAANYSIANKYEAKLSSYDVAADNITMGMDLLSVAQDTISTMQNHGARLQALITQARNGTYGAQSLNAMTQEAGALISEIQRMYLNTEYNGISLFDNLPLPSWAKELKSTLATEAGAGAGIEEGVTVGIEAGQKVGLLTDITPKANGFIADIETVTPDVVVESAGDLADAIADNDIIGIANASVLKQLATLVNGGTNCAGKTIVLTDDIDLSAYQAGSGWASIGTSSNNFNGTFDGNGHVIKNLKINKSTTDYQGLFGYTASDSTIKNVGIINCDVIGNYFTGGLIGYGSDSNIHNCYVNGTITGSLNTGGLVGEIYSTDIEHITITSCYANVNVIGNADNSGGLIGHTTNVDILNCFTKGSIVSTGEWSCQFGGLVGYIENSTIRNSYSACNTTNNGFDGCTGGLVGATSSDCLISNSYSTGTVTGEGQYTGGLVGHTYNTTVENCYSTSDVIGKGYYTGGLVGHAQDISNSYATGNVTGEGQYTGGLVGYAAGAISNSYSTGSITGENQYTGGLVGQANGAINNSYSTGSITGENQYTGGLVGYTSSASAKVTNCYSTGDVLGKNNYTGGLVGQAKGNISNSYSTGSVTGEGQYTGGLVGNTDSSSPIVTNCYSTGDVLGKNRYTGGLVGYAYGAISNSYSTGNVTGEGQYTGGLAGITNSYLPGGGTVTYCYSTGDVLGKNNFTGGLVGQTYSAISNSYSTGSVTGEGQYTGGLAGTSSTIINCFSTSEVLGKNNYTGGLVGLTSVAPNNAYATGNVIGTRWVGGLVGEFSYSFGTVDLDKMCSLGKVNGEEQVGSLIGGIINTSNGSDFATINITNAATLKQNLNVIGFEGKYDGTAYESGQMNDWLANIKEVKPAETNLQVGIMGNESSRITFDTGFEYDLSAILSDIKSDKAYSTITQFMSTLSEKATDLGAASNRLESALDSVLVNMENLTSSLSTVKDVDMAQESSQYIRMQILQQASATLLATANQSPSIALQLI